MYTAELHPDVSQGDIFETLPLVTISEEAEGGNLTVSLREGRAVLLTHDCEYDKPNNPWVLVAEVRVLAEIPSGSQGLFASIKHAIPFIWKTEEKRFPSLT